MEEHYQSFMHTGGSSKHSNENTECMESSTIENESSCSTNSSAVGEALIEFMLQPHQVQTGGGGGDSDNRGWRDDDRDKDNNKNRTYKRRR